jgi:hypothetical protein
MFPGKVTILAMVIGPGEEFNYPGCAHFSHQFQAALDFPGFYFVGQASMDTEDRMLAQHGLEWPRRNQNGSRLEKDDYKSQGQEAQAGGELKHGDRLMGNLPYSFSLGYFEQL